MKELTIEEKAKRYDKAIERAKSWYVDAQIDFKKSLETLFPELIESEDEKIRKAIYIYLDWLEGRKDYAPKGKYSIRDMLAWLEKQGEQKINDDDKTILENWKCIVKDNKEKWQLSDWFVEATLLLVQKIEQIGLSKPIVDNNKTMLNACINTLRNVGHSHLAAWLENQGETTDVDPVFSYNNLVTKKQNAKKPTDKVEPKFKVGDWVFIKEVKGYKNGPFQIKAVDSFGYSFDEYHIIPFMYKDLLSKWTIQDAKDGDVLYLQHDGKEHIIIYKGVIKERFRTFISAYCAYNSIVDAFCFADVSRYTDIAYGGIMPATKEQRDTLFAKMKEAGYEWDVEKKELKKIENEIEIPFGAKDSELQEATYYIPKGFYSVLDGNKVIIKRFKNPRPQNN